MKRIFVSEKMAGEYYRPVSEVMHRDTSIHDDLVGSLSKFRQHLRSNSSFFRQGIAALLISVVAGLFAGIFLGSSEEMLLALPGLIVLVPAAIGMRGNIFSSLGSRLGSALHLGTLESFSFGNRVVRQNIYSSILISVIFSVILAFIARVVLLSFGIKSITLLSLIVISFIGGMISGIVLLAMTFMIAFASYNRGWDPDNVTSPVITALGDVITIPSLLLAAYLMLSYAAYESLFAAAILLLFIASLAIVVRSRPAAFKKIILQSSPILVIGIMLDALAGMILQSNISNLTMLPIVLFLIPGFLEQGGNIGNILASRLSTRLHLGNMESSFSPNKEIRSEIANTYIFALILFPVLGALTFAAGSFVGIGGLSAYQILRSVLISGLIITTVIVTIAFFISVISFRLKVDPDNTTLPLIASTADVIGVVTLMAVMHAFGIF